MNNQHWADPIEGPTEQERQADDRRMLLAVAVTFVFWVGLLCWVMA
jgi:hypothetical protein